MRRITSTLGIRRRVEGEPDRYGNPRVSYAEPIDWPVYAIAPSSPGDAEPDRANRDVVITGITIYAPIDGTRPGALDLVRYRGEDWQVVGEVGEWDRNPHTAVTRHRGIVVNLERSEG